MIEKYILKHRKNSEPVQVLKYTGSNYDEVLEFIGDNWKNNVEYAPKEWFVGFKENVLEFKDETGGMYCYADDYIIDKGNDENYPNRFYPARKHLFELDYELYTT